MPARKPSRRTPTKRKPKMPNRIKELRDERGFTQEKLGELCGVPHASIQKIETRKMELGSWWVIKLAAALQVHPGELFAPLPADTGLDELAPIWRILPQDDRTALMKHAQALRIANEREAMQPDPATVYRHLLPTNRS